MAPKNGSNILRALDLSPSHDRACIYIRQSVERDESISAELQEQACRDYAVAHGYTVVDVVTDLGKTGRTTNKRQIHSVVDRVAAGEYAVILVWKWSRISRSRTDWALLADKVAVAGGRIESATEPIDTATASGRFARGVMTEYAAFQSEQIGEQWQEVFERRMKLGLPPNGVLPWGWEKGPQGITISPENAATIRQMYALYQEGRGLVFIANWLNASGLLTKRGKLWQFASVRACLESPFHAGFISHQGVLRQGAHAGVITEDEYARFMDARQDRSVPKKPRRSPYLLSTICICHCGRKRVGNVSGKRGRSYACTATESHPRKYRVCSAVDALVDKWVMGLDFVAEAAAASPPVDTRILRDKAARLEKGITTLNVDHALGSLSSQERDAARSAMREEIDALQSQIGAAERVSRNTVGAYTGGQTNLAETWPYMTTVEKQATLRTIIHWVRIQPDDSIVIRPRWESPDVVIGSS